MESVTEEPVSEMFEALVAFLRSISWAVLLDRGEIDRALAGLPIKTLGGTRLELGTFVPV